MRYKSSIQLQNLRRSAFAAIFLAATLGYFDSVRAAESPLPFAGEKSAWRDGFDRFDYVMDEATLAITPFKAPDGEKFAVRDPAKGQRRCVVVAPEEAAAGRPWSWRGCYWDHQPQTEVELLRRGFHVAYFSANATLKPGKEWDAWYEFLTEIHGLSKKPGFIGMSRGGEYAYAWAIANPDKVSCIYGENPILRSKMSKTQPLDNLAPLAKAGVPLLHVCGSLDPALADQTRVLEKLYHELGGQITVIIKEGEGHYPLAPRDPKPVVDFIVEKAK